MKTTGSVSSGSHMGCFFCAFLLGIICSLVLGDKVAFTLQPFLRESRAVFISLLLFSTSFNKSSRPLSYLVGFGQGHALSKRNAEEKVPVHRKNIRFVLLGKGS